MPSSLDVSKHVWRDEYQDAMDAVIADDPGIRKLVLLVKDNPKALEAAIAAAHSPGIVERGLRTSEKDICRLIDAVLERQDVRALLCIVLGKAEDDAVDRAAGPLQVGSDASAARS